MHKPYSGTGMTNTHTKKIYRNLKGRFCSIEEGLRADQYHTWVKTGLQRESEATLKALLKVKKWMKQEELAFGYCFLWPVRPSDSGIASDFQYHGRYKKGS